MKCNYCQSGMKYGKDYAVIAMSLSICLDDKTHPLMGQDMDRAICYPCYVKMLDWLADAAGCKAMPAETESGERA